jgi:hypothetical protein
VRVRVDESGHQRGIAEVDHPRVCRNSYLSGRSDSRDRIVGDNYNRVGDRRPSRSID